MGFFLSPISYLFIQRTSNFHGPYPFQYSGETAYNGLLDMMVDAFYFYFLVFFYLISLSIHLRMVN